MECQQRVEAVSVERSVANYIVELARRTREDSRLSLGCSPRGSLMLFRAAQACAFLDQRDYVLPDDVQRIAPFVMQHRVVLSRNSQPQGRTAWDLICGIIKQVDVPV